MSNLQDVSLTEPEVQPLTDSGQGQVSRTSSLKRFFKVSKKPVVLDPVENVSEAPADDDKKTNLRKTKTLSRIFSRKKKDSSKDGHEQSTSMGNPISQDMPLTNEKHGIRSSMSVYWKRLFQRQKSQRHGALSGQDMCADNEPEEEVPELQVVQNEPEIQVQPTICLEEPQLESNQEAKPEAKPEAIAEPEPIRPKKPKKANPIASNMPEEEDVNALEDGQRHVAAAEPEDEQQAPEYYTLYP